MGGYSKSLAVVLLLFLVVFGAAALIDELSPDSLASSTSAPESIANPASSTSSPEVKVPVGRLTADYVKELPAYSVEFKAEPADYGVEFNAYDTPLRFKPIGLTVGEEHITPTLEPRIQSENSVEYRSVFGDGIDINYQIEESKLKESIIIQREDDLPSAALSSSTTSIDFVLTYPDYIVPSVDGVEWDTKLLTTDKDISFVHRREQNRIYAVNEFYRIKAPFLNDSGGQVVNLDYTLEQADNQTFLRINIPSGLDSLEYPVIIDPTVYLNTNNDGFMWRNNRSCGTHTSNCTGYIQTDNMDFYIPYMCTPNVEKSLWRFFTSHLGYDYLGSVYSAQLYLKSSSYSYSYMNSNENIRLYEIAPFQSSPSCGGHNDANVTAQLALVMNKTGCYYDSSGGWVDIKNNFNNSVYNHRNISFKIDVDPVRGESDNPAGNIKYDENDAQLYIQYYFTCVDSGYCPTTDFCNGSGTHLCNTDLSYGAYCEGVAVDNDNYACQNNNCQYDDFDGSGHYCAESNRCVHNGTRYYTGDIHCFGSNWYKTCQADTTWTTQTNCSYGCNDGTGCLTTTTTTSTTTTTTSTTTTTTTTTLAPNIQINPTTLTHRRNAQ